MNSKSTGVKIIVFIYLHFLFFFLFRLPLKKFSVSPITPNHSTVFGDFPTNVSTSGRPSVTTSAQPVVVSASPWPGDVSLLKLLSITSGLLHHT